MTNKELQEKLKNYDNDKPIVFFSNGFKGKIDLTERDDSLVISGIGDVYPNPKTALEGKPMARCSYSTPDVSGDDVDEYCCDISSIDGEKNS